MSLLIIGIYLIIIIPLVLALTTKADNRPLVAIFLLWLMAYPVLVQEEIMPHVGGYFDLQPTRMMLLVVLPALVLNRLVPEALRKRSFAPLSSFEKFLVAYVAASIFAIAINYESLGIKQVVSGVEKQLAFGVFYFSARDYLSRDDYRVIERGIIVLGIFSALVAIIQFDYDPYFFRVGGSFRSAFANVGRSTGAFGEEYEHAMYLTFATIAVGLWQNGRPLWHWIGLATLFGISVVVTFQRMPWAGFLLAIVGVLIIRKWEDSVWRNVGIVMTGLGLALVIWMPWSEIVSYYLPQKFVTGRLMADTLSDRIAFNEFAVWLMPKYPLGLGETIGSPIYNQEFYNYGLDLRSGGIGYTIHNGFLSAAVRFGIAGGLAFGGMLFSFLVVSARRAVTSNLETFILPLLAAVLILYNLTEDFAATTGQIILLGGWLMGCFVGHTLYQERRQGA